MYKFLKGFANILAHIFYRVKIIGKENIPDEGAYSLCGNHLHAFDYVFLVANTKRKIHFIAKAELFKHWFMRWIEKPFGLIRVDRSKTQDIESMKKSLKVLKDGEILGIFPEGTRNGLAKNVEVKTGVAYFTVKTGVKVIPVGINGNFKLFSKVTYNIGQPMDFSEYFGRKPNKEDLDSITDKIMSNIIELTNQKI